MNRRWRMLEKILTGQKTIESRWYIHVARRPKVSKGDIIYFRNTGEPVTVKAVAKEVLELNELDAKKIVQVLEQYGDQIGIERECLPIFQQMFKEKKYGLLIFLSTVEKVKPFSIDKHKYGYCARSAWVSANKIEAPGSH